MQTIKNDIKNMLWEYGGVSLHIKRELGGESDVFNTGHISKPEMAIRLDSFLEGIFNAKELL